MLKICMISHGYMGFTIYSNMENISERLGMILIPKVDSLKKGIDHNDEFKKKDIRVKNLIFSKKIEDIHKCNFYIICVQHL